MRTAWALSPGRRAGMWRSARRLRFTPAYVGGVLAGGVALSLTGPATRRRVVQACSTNVHNLAQGRWWTLLTSALVLPGLYAAGAVPLSLVLALAEAAWGWQRLVAVFLYGHVLATLIVYVVLRRGLASGRVDTQVAMADDVGVSYGAAATLGALVMTLPWSGAGIYAAACVAAFALALGRHRTFTDLGHLVALVLGLVAGAWHRRRLGSAAAGLSLA